VTFNKLTSYTYKDESPLTPGTSTETAVEAGVDGHNNGYVKTDNVFGAYLGVNYTPIANVTLRGGLSLISSSTETKYDKNDALVGANSENLKGGNLQFAIPVGIKVSF
jgi:hypothetical protein